MRLGDTFIVTLKEMDAIIRVAKEQEREACAKVAESYEPTCDSCPRGVAIAIRSRSIDGAKVGEVGVWGEENPHDHVDTVTKSTNPMQNPHKHKENT